MPRYIEQLNENITPATGDWLWIVDVSAEATDQDRKLSVGKLAMLATANVFTAANAFAEIISANKGVAFPATQVASADANTLDDYEEGTWTPTYLGATTNPTVSYATRAGKYTKVGRLVICHFRILTTSVSGGSGLLLLGGLPFATNSSSIDGGNGSGSVYHADAFTTNHPQGLGNNPGNSSMYATYQAGNAATVLMSVANLSAGADSNALRGSFSYIID